MKSLDEYFQQFDDDPISGHYEVQLVRAGHIRIVSGPLLDHRQHPEQHAVEHVTYEGHGHAQDGHAQTHAPESLFRRGQLRRGCVDEELPFVLLQRKDRLPGQLTPFLVEPDHVSTDVYIVVRVDADVVLEVQIGGGNEEEQGHGDQLLQEVDHYLEYVCPVGELLLHLVTNFEHELRSFRPRFVVRFWVDVELEGASQGLHGRLCGVDGVVDRLAGPLRRLAQRIAVVQVLANEDGVQWLADIRAVTPQPDVVIRATIKQSNTIMQLLSEIESCTGTRNHPQSHPAHNGLSPLPAFFTATAVILLKLSPLPRLPQFYRGNQC